MKIIDERERQKIKTERNKGVMETVVKVWDLNDVVVHLGFLQLICKASLIFKSNLELALSIIVKKSIIWVKACMSQSTHESKHALTRIILFFKNNL